MIPANFRKPRVGIVEGKCNTCGDSFMRTANEVKKCHHKCPKCFKLRKQLSTPKPRPGGPRLKKHWEIVLPKTRTPHYDKSRGEWYMRVRTRKRGSKDPLVPERIWLGVTGPEKTQAVEDAYAAAYTRKEMEGCVRIPRERVIKYNAQKHQRFKDFRSWRQGRDRDLGVSRVIVKYRRFKVCLPDPLTVDGKVRVGTFADVKVARKARDEKYRELQDKLVPCAVCGKLPTWLRGQLTHLNPDKCPNSTQLPLDTRKLYQAKLWNLVFSKGEHEPGVYSGEDLAKMGYMRKQVGAKQAYARVDVEWDLSLHVNYVGGRKKTVEPEEEDWFLE